MMRKLADTPRALWASPDYLARRGTPTAPADLADHDAVLFRKGMYSDWTLSRGEEEVNVRVDGPFAASGGDNLVQAAQAGLGILMAPNWLVSGCVNEGQLVRILPDWEMESLPVNCVWTAGRLRGKTKLFADHVTEALKAAMTCD
jgi:DNA-binding transcriptional LysR family regulator